MSISFFTQAPLVGLAANDAVLRPLRPNGRGRADLQVQLSSASAPLRGPADFRDRALQALPLGVPCPREALRRGIAGRSQRRCNQASTDASPGASSAFLGAVARSA